MGPLRGGLRALVLGLCGRPCLDIALIELGTSVEEEGFAAYARGASERHCPYGDQAHSAAWSRGFRRAERLDASVW
jgi:ribosome modulation factor